MMTAQTVTISVPLVYGEITAFFELGSTRKIDLRRDIIVHDTETSGILHVPDRWLVQGPVTKSDPGKSEQKAAGDASIEMQAYYIMHWLDGEEILEWHAFNAIHTVNKKDLLAETRRNLLL